MTWRFVPLIGVRLFLGLGLGLRPWLHTRRYGDSGVMLFRSGRHRQHLRDALLVLLLVVITGQAVGEAISPGAVSVRRSVLSPGITVSLRPLGAILFLGGLALFLIAQYGLGASWRIGIEERARPGLVTTGVYRFCRNPIFLFMLTMLVGFTILLPTWLSVVMLAGIAIGVYEQARAEEEYLLGAYGGAYRTYARRVGRFSPWTGRLRS